MDFNQLILVFCNIFIRPQVMCMIFKGQVSNWGKGGKLAAHGLPLAVAQVSSDRRSVFINWVETELKSLLAALHNPAFPSPHPSLLFCTRPDSHIGLSTWLL